MHYNYYKCINGSTGRSLGRIYRKSDLKELSLYVSESHHWSFPLQPMRWDDSLDGPKVLQPITETEAFAELI